MTTAQALIETLQSSVLSNSNLENANIVDALDDHANAIRALRNAITPVAAGSKDAGGGYVESLTEAIMGMTGGLVRVAESISELAEAVRQH